MCPGSTSHGIARSGRALVPLKDAARLVRMQQGEPAARLPAQGPSCKRRRPMTTALVHIALTAYIAAAVFFLVWLVRPQRLYAPDATSRLVSAGRAMLLVGVVLHLASF